MEEELAEWACSAVKPVAVDKAMPESYTEMAFDLLLSARLRRAAV
jgi:hypothetical protein